MTARHDETYYRSLLEAAQQASDNSKAFLEAIGNSKAVRVTVQRIAKSATANMVDSI